MHFLGNISVLFLAIMLIGPSSTSYCQSNTLKGTVILSAKTKKKRTSRGSSYRNRVKGDIISANDQLKSDQFNQVIVCLKPLNFTAETSPLENARVVQKNKSFSPQMLAVTLGTIVEFENRDDFYHNVFSLTPKSRFNIGRRPAGSVNGVKIKKHGIINVFCDIHPQMKATIVSLATPYFSTVSDSGNYVIKDLPDGKYQIEIYILDHKFLLEEIELKNGAIHNADLILDNAKTAYLENNSSHFLADDTCCETGG